jgi:hypothetical protein
MAEVRLDRARVERELPPVCICCGAPVSEYRRRWFIHTPLRNIPFAFLGTWRYWRVSLAVPFCAAHRSYFTRQWLPLLAVALFTIGAAVAAYITTDITQGKEQARALYRILIPAVLGVLVVLYVIGKVMKYRSVHVSAVDRDGFTLANVNDRFAAAVEGRGSRGPVILEAAEDDIPEVLPAGRVPEVRPITPAARRRPPPAPAARRPRRRSSLPLVMIAFGSAIIIGLIIAGGGILALRLMQGGSAVRLSNARVTRMGLLLRFDVDHRPAQVDPAAAYFLVIRSGRSTVVEQRLPANAIATAGTLNATTAQMPRGQAGPFDGVIEVEHQDGPREAVSNVVRFH